MSAMSSRATATASVPSASILASGILIKPVVPKSDARTRSDRRATCPNTKIIKNRFNNSLSVSPGTWRVS